MSKDTVYREAVIRVASEECHEFRGIFGRIEERIKELPSADRPQGEWIPIIEADEFGEPFQAGIQCSECGEQLAYYANFCPNCGADMRGEDDADNL